MGCSGCREGEAKLGRCAFCITANLLGATIGWIAFGVLLVLYPEPSAERIVFLLAAFFTLFFAAHAIAYVRRHFVERAGGDHSA